MNAKMVCLAQARHREEFLKATKNDLELELQEVKAWDELEHVKDELKTIKETQDELKQQVYEEAIQVHDASGGENTQPHPHVKIQMGTDVVYDTERAIEWALLRDNTHHLLNITLRKRVFEKFARAGWPIDCVAVEENTPKPVIDSDLSDLLDF